MVRLFEIALNGFGAESSEILSFGTWGSYGNQKIHIAPDENWEGLVITAYFRLDNEPVGSCLFGEDMTIDIPPEATAKPTSGSVKGKVTFRGTQDGRVIITTDLPYFVLNHSDTEESDNKYTPDQWSQFVSQVDASRKAAEEASAQASESAAQAAQSLSDTKQVESNVIYQGSTAVQNIQSSLSAATASINAQTNRSLSAIQSKQDEAVAAISEQVSEAQKSASIAAQYASNAEASANAAAENASKVQQEVESGISAIGDATESAKSEIQTAKTAAVDAVNQTKTQAVSSVITQQNSSIQAVQAAQNTAVQAVQTAQTEGVKAVNDAATEKVEEIEQINALVPTPTPEDAGKVVVVKPDGTGYELGDAGSEIDDTVVAPDTTWSSLNIVNKLCPPFSVTGDVVQFNPVDGYPLSVQSTIVATQEGTGDPSPENVRPIVPVDEVSAWVGGKNLWGGRLFKAIYSASVPSIFNDEEVVFPYTPSGSTRGLAVMIPVKANQMFSFKAFSANENATYRYAIYKDSKSAYDYKNKLTYGILSADERFEVLESGVMVFMIGGTYDASGDGIHAFTDDEEFQLELGTSATAYEPYRGQLYTASLPEPCYGGTVDLTGGTGKVTALCETLLAENVTGYGTDQYGRANFTVNLAVRTPILKTPTISNILPYKLGSGDLEHFYQAYASGAVLVHIDKSRLSEDSLEGAKTFISQANMQVLYYLSTPTTLTITPLEIPAPTSPATAYSTSGEITVSGRSDPVEYINQQIANAIAIAKA